MRQEPQALGGSVVHAQARSLSQTRQPHGAGTPGRRSAGLFAPTSRLRCPSARELRRPARRPAGGVVGAALVASSVLLLTDLWAGRAPCQCCWPRAPPPPEGAPTARTSMLRAWSSAARMRLMYG